MRRLIGRPSATLAAAAVLAACPGTEQAGAPGSAGDGPVERGGTAVVAELADMDKPMPIISESSLDNELNNIMYMRLLADRWEDGRVRYLTSEENPTALARGYEFFGPDSASLRYHLRTDVLWSDGEPVTAHDAVWTIEAQGDPRTASPRQDYNEQIREVVAEDDSTVVVHFHRRYPDMFFHSAGHVAPRHVFEGADLAQLRSHPAVANPAANLPVSGPFMVGEWRRGQQVVLIPNPNFSPQPNLDRIVFRVIPEPTTRLIELETGGVDLMTPIPYDQVERFRRGGAIRIERREKRAFDYIAYNPGAHPFFADPEVRRALGLALDPDGLIRALQMEEFAVAAGGPYAPIFRDLYDPEAHAPLPHDPVLARQILEARGWAPGPDGILRNAQGQRFRFTLATNAGNQRRADVAQIVQQQWRRIGVDVQIQIQETNTFFDRLTRREFEAVVSGWNVGLSPDLQQLWGDPDLPFNFVSYDNPRARALIQQALAQPTEEQAAPYWREVAATIVADHPYTWLFYFDHVIGISNRLRGTRIDTLGTYQEIWNWWIPRAQQRGSPAAATTP